MVGLRSSKAWATNFPATGLDVTSGAAAVACYYVSLFVVVLGVAFSVLFVPICPASPAEARERGGFIGAFVACDGIAYRKILETGYSYCPGRASNIAYFPLYPLAARLVSAVSGLPPDISLLLVAHASLVGTFLMFAAYLRTRFPGDLHLQAYCILAFSFFPPGIFFRLAYSESLFLFLMTFALFGMIRRWKWPLVAVCVALATATRAVGVAIIVALVIWGVHDRKEKCGFIVGAVALSLSGLLAWMLFQYCQYGDPLAFSSAQAHWHARDLPSSAWEGVLRFVTFEPIWATFDSDVPSLYWRNSPPCNLALFNLSFANPCYFCVVVGSMILGAWRRWLTHEEVALGFALLLVTYGLRGLGTGMISMARYSAVVIPVYIVFGRVLAKLGGPAAALIVALSACFLFVYAALFAGCYWVF